jgi:hypothetical protein
MTQDERDRLVTLKKAKKKLISQKEAAKELEVDPRHLRRMLVRLQEQGDKSVVHGLKGKPSNRRIKPATQQKAVTILSQEVYQGFGPTLAMESLRDKHHITVSKETVRQWMLGAKLWRAQQVKAEPPHVWRPRRSRWGELVQWDTSEHDWLEGRGEKMYLIAMIDDATSQLMARFAPHDSTAENLRLLRAYLEKHGRPEAFYTDKASLFQTTEKRKRDEPGLDQDPREMPPTQIGRALRELRIVWIGAHSPQAKGRIERSFDTAQDRLVKGMREAEVNTLEQANRYLEQTYLPWWNQTRTVKPVREDNAHRALEPEVDLAAVLCPVITRQVANDYTIQLDRVRYQIDRAHIRTGLRKAVVRIEQRLDGSLAVRHQDQYLHVTRCEPTPRPVPAKLQPAGRHGLRKKSEWNKNFNLKNAPPIWQAARASGRKTGSGD